eukprot:CAMPEP_0178505066 /NCGR_PEP_ID=MMETSP0696-20121128/18932_1 /TAXON_ID=265572 /ORGANISM="Extubocellulus spinifer, Strain CCMP396" /LENGTH=482 /DNA_ID=CAMNT_0020134351 /DNA_START=205 /DNA_END=1653 /DNA_ORIENTATION=+
MVLHFAPIALILFCAPLAAQAVSSGDDSDTETSLPTSSPRKRRKVTAKRTKAKIGPLHPTSETGKLVREVFENHLKYYGKNLPADKFAISPYQRERKLEDFDLLDSWLISRGLEPTHLTDKAWYTQSTLPSAIKRIAEAVTNEHIQAGNAERAKRVAEAAAVSTPTSAFSPGSLRPTRKVHFASPSSAAKSPAPSTTTPTMNLNSKMKSMSLGREDAFNSPPIKACQALMHGRKKGDNDGSGEPEYYSFLFRVAPCKIIESDGTKSDGIVVALPGTSGVPILQYHFSVTRPDEYGRQWLRYQFKNKDTGQQELPLPFREPSTIPDAWQDKVANSDFHAVHNNGVDQFEYHHVFAKNSGNRDDFEDAMDRCKDNPVIFECPLPCLCESNILKYGLSHPTLDRIVLSTNPTMVRSYHEKYSECTSDANKKQFLKLIGMSGSIVVVLRQLDLNEDRKQAADGFGRVDAPPTAAAAANNDFDMFTT